MWILLASCNRDDITQAGVYFLFCKEDDGSDSVYIGEAENVKERLVQHLRDYQSEKEKYYWTTAAMFVIGKSANGLTSWKVEDGRSLKDIENSEME